MAKKSKVYKAKRKAKFSTREKLDKVITSDQIKTSQI